MRLVITFLTALAASASAAHRSQGYAGSTPVGLDGYVAFTQFDCARINADSRRSRERVPLSVDCMVAIPSPDGHLTVRAASRDQDAIVLTVADGFVITGLEQPTTFLWNPNSSAFLLNDSEGSGQTSHLRYFYKDGPTWRESRALAVAANRLYRRRFDCRAGRKSYTNTSGWNWTRSGLLRIIVQEGVHSEGCLQPHHDRNVLFEVIGDPVTGQVTSSREIDSLP